MNQDSNQRRLCELKLQLKKIEVSLDDKNASLCQLQRDKDEYCRKCRQSDQRLERLNDELVGAERDYSLEGRKREEQMVELQRRLDSIQQQQLNLKDAAVASLRTPHFNNSYKTSSCNLEAKLRSQIDILRQRDFHNSNVAFVNLKKREIAQESRYGQRLEELNGNLYDEMKVRERTIPGLERQKQATKQKISQLEKKIYQSQQLTSLDFGSFFTHDSKPMLQLKDKW
ncbi:uncharacterized protein [Lepeophtheirus salmonis]|uniref:Uncharacterized protein n=1 Tax=Lepeophtheirus salmonis TaxID=72036 RepID=A0A0K2TQX0_LEPSM|nr:uncharacterized protein LOC121131305 [Lepeophtheirus salmonis]